MEKGIVTEQKSGLAAKDVSLKSMIAAAVWIGALSIVKALWGLVSDKAFGLSMGEIVLSGLMMAAVFPRFIFPLCLTK